MQAQGEALQEALPPPARGRPRGLPVPLLEVVRLVTASGRERRCDLGEQLMSRSEGIP